MNWLTHFLTGYLIARLKGYKYNQFETFYISLACTIPDFDVLFIAFAPHGTWSHTLLFGLVLAIIYASIFYIIIRKSGKISNASFIYLILFAIIGVLAHLFKDIFTYLKGDCLNSIAHLYFYPFSNFSVHMNCIWPNTTYLHRILVEYIYFGILIVLIIYRWIKYNENLLHLFKISDWKKIYHENRKN